MKADTTLLPFYLGSLNDDDRLKIERQMLTDPEVLLDYLDLKREIEGAISVPQAPSPAVWNRLRSKIKSSKRTYISLALGFAVAAVASIVFVILTQSRPEPKAPAIGQGILFDSGSEQFGHSNVL